MPENGSDREGEEEEEESRRERERESACYFCAVLGLQHTLPRHRGIALGDVTRAQRHRPIGGSR